MNNEKIELSALSELSVKYPIEENKQMAKPVYSTDKALNCGVVEYSGRRYLMDNEDKDQIINFPKNFIFFHADDIYPSYLYNTGRVNFLQFIFGYKPDRNVKFVFKNENKLDLRKENVVCQHEYHEEVCKKYTVLEYIPGHYYKNGIDPYCMKNPLWRVHLTTDISKKEYLLMYCEPKTLCILCTESYIKIKDFEKINEKKNTFYTIDSGYIYCTYGLSIHQIITGCYGNGKGTKKISVDHIDRNVLNNTFTNLRIATRDEQEENKKGHLKGTKRERKHNAKPLPAGLTQNMMRKYVVYYHEWLDVAKTKSREYFKIERHPKLGEKIWLGTKSGKIALKDKLAAVNKVADNLECDVYPATEKKETGLPPHFSISNTRNKPHLVYEERVEAGHVEAGHVEAGHVEAGVERRSLKMALPAEYILAEQVLILQDKIKAKYLAV